MRAFLFSTSFNSVSEPTMSLTLRRANVEDAPAFMRLMADPEVFANLMQLPHPCEASWRERLATVSGPDNANLHLVALRGDEVVGSAGLHPSVPVRRRHAMNLGISVARAAQGQGVGHALMAALLDYADNWAQALRVELTVFTDNARAIALYQRHGFETEGRLRGFAFRAGRYEDVFTMARWHPAPPALQPH
jgi:putative acetyltransferase